MPEYLRSPKFSILDAMWTVCPNKQKRGIVIPTTPATTGPEQTKDQQNDWRCKVYEIIHFWTAVVDESEEWSSQ